MSDEFVSLLQTAQLLPTEVCTEQQSLVVIKRLLAIAVSGITYLRGIFPGRAYGSKYVEGWITNETAFVCIGCFDAIQKKYVSHFCPDGLCYFYNFLFLPLVFLISNTNQKLSTMSCGNTKKASILLVRKLYTLMQNLGPLPENVCLNMKLAYYEDVTPPDYQPPGFKEAEGDVMEFEQEPVKLAMGEVATPFHCVKFDMATEKQRLEQVTQQSVDIKNVSVKEKWLMRIDEHDVITQVCKNSDVKFCLKVAYIIGYIILCQMDTLVKKASDLDVGLKRTRSGRIIKSTMVSQYDILSSQESSAPVAKKKRKFSEPKDHC
uniref:HORMA domain containing 1 n=1 Tax=Kryptolebias marmoratus TaxID=37003 RepID=A0A3Q3B4T9_KRYMA